MGVDPEVFFPLPSDRTGIAAAKAICAECPVRTQCLMQALEYGDGHGIFGGLTPAERREVRLNSAPGAGATAA